VKRQVIVVLCTLLFAGCATQPMPAPEPVMPSTLPTPSVEPAVAPDAAERLGQLPRTGIDYDRSLLSDEDQRVVAKLIDAAKLIDEIFWLQVSEKNRDWFLALSEAARVSSLHQAAFDYFIAMKGPWDRLKEDEPFVMGVGEKPGGAAFYPPDITKEEFERWIAAHPEDKEAFQGLFTVIRRQGSLLYAIPYSEYYGNLLGQAAARLREAAALSSNASLRDYLTKRAAALLSDDYYESDIAWMDLNSAIEVVVGPYEVYEDGLFNYKAAFEAFVTAVDRPESEKLGVYTAHLPEMERNLPMPDQHKNPNRGTDSPIRVVQEIFTAGDARSGVQTAAFNLPNDERVREAKGSKKVLLKNVMEAKYRQSGNPIALRVLDSAQTPLISFDAYFNHVLFHELSHGLGPGIITGPDGKRVETRLLLKELYSAIEEAKADVLGLWNVLYAVDRKLLTGVTEQQLYATDVGLMFRSMRFGLGEAHGRGTAAQWNWYREKGAIVPQPNGRYRVDFDRMREAVRSLAAELLMIEATGDYDRARRLLEQYGKSTAEIEGVIARLRDIPVDIRPVFAAAGER
jgi:hypothetical protein